MAKVNEYSPWGKIQHLKEVQEGIQFVVTAGHGGFKLDRKRNHMMPKYMRAEGGWYEEDCEYAKVALVFKIFQTDKCEENAKKTLAHYNPDAYEQFYGVTLQPGESYHKDQMNFQERNKNNYVTVAAVGDWHKDCPKGYVLVSATLGGVRKYDHKTQNWSPTKEFLVPEDEYDQRSQFGFVVDTNKHQEFNPKVA